MAVLTGDVGKGDPWVLVGLGGEQRYLPRIALKSGWIPGGVCVGREYRGERKQSRAGMLEGQVFGAGETRAVSSGARVGVGAWVGDLEQKMAQEPIAFVSV